MTRHRAALRWTAAAAVVAVLVLLGRDLDWHGVRAVLARSDPRLLALATLVNLGSQVATGLSWWLFLRPWGVRSYATTIRADFVGAALNDLLPWNAGDAARIWLVAAMERIAAVRVLGALAAERLATLLAGLLLLAAAGWALSLPEPLATAAHLVAVGVTAGIAVYLLISRRWPGAAARVPFAVRLLRRVRDADLTPMRLGAGLALGAAAWLLQLATYALAAAAVGVRPGPGGTVTLLAMANLGFVVRLTPASVGVFQAIYAATAGGLGIPADAAVAAAIVLQALQVVPVVAIGALLVPSILRSAPSADPAAAAGGPVTGRSGAPSATPSGARRGRSDRRWRRGACDLVALAARPRTGVRGGGAQPWPAIH